MRPGEIQRWRIINANQNAQSAFALFRFGEEAGDFPTMYKIAQDGVQFSPERWAMGTELDTSKDATNSGSIFDNPLFLAPGNRVDFLAVAPLEPGTYQVVARSAQPQAHNVNESIFRTERPALTIEVVGDPVPADEWQLPETLPPMPEFLASITDDEIDRERSIIFSM